MKDKPYVMPCSAFGGRSPKTGKRVGARHRWSGGAGKGSCEFCGRSLSDVLRNTNPSQESGAVANGTW